MVWKSSLLLELLDGSWTASRRGKPPLTFLEQVRESAPSATCRKSMWICGTYVRQAAGRPSRIWGQRNETVSSCVWYATTLGGVCVGVGGGGDVSVSSVPKQKERYGSSLQFVQKCSRIKTSIYEFWANLSGVIVQLPRVLCQLDTEMHLPPSMHCFIAQFHR